MNWSCLGAYRNVEPKKSDIDVPHRSILSYIVIGKYLRFTTLSFLRHNLNAQDIRVHADYFLRRLHCAHWRKRASRSSSTRARDRGKRLNKHNFTSDSHTVVTHKSKQCQCRTRRLRCPSFPAHAPVSTWIISPSPRTMRTTHTLKKRLRQGG